MSTALRLSVTVPHGVQAAASTGGVRPADGERSNDQRSDGRCGTRSPVSRRSLW